MKLISKLLASVTLTSLVLLTGCKSLTPQGASALTTTAVYAFGRNNPKIVETMRKVQPLACDMAKNPGATVEDVVGIIENAGGVNSDTAAVINVLLAIYQTSIAPVGTNQAKTHPYLEAVICPGWEGGLALLPMDGPMIGGVTKNAIPKKVSSQVPGKWVLVK
jgi:hypothetical protein